MEGSASAKGAVELNSGRQEMGHANWTRRAGDYIKPSTRT